MCETPKDEIACIWSWQDKNICDDIWPTFTNYIVCGLNDECLSLFDLVNYVNLAYI